MSTPIPSLGGVLPVVQLPLNSDETIDVETLAREVEWLLGHGVHGLTMGMVTETYRLTADERIWLSTLLCNQAAGRVPVIISVGAESAYAAVDFARRAEAAGAAAIMAAPPFLVAAVGDELYAYFARIADATSLPLIVQDASGYVGRPIDVGLQLRLLAAYGSDRIYFKPEATPVGPVISALRDGSSGGARIFEGSGGIALVDNFHRGIAGAMPGADLIVGFVALWNALQDERQDTVDALSPPLSALTALQTGLDGFLAVEKYLLVRQNVFRNAVVRGPVGFQLDAETRREVDRLFALLMRAVQSSGHRAIA